MTNDEAREYFKKCNLDYSILIKPNRELLRKILKEELENHIIDHGYVKHYIRIRKKVKSDLRINDIPEVELYNISCRGSWFDKRQGITFERNGFIGFAGWASSKNTQPFLKAFIKWCDKVKTR
jgi:hypothetical protein